jgi:BR serine/threonine kinase
MSLAGKRIGDYQVLELLGAGNSAKVKLARHINTGQLVAVKILKKANLTKKPILYGKLQREIALLSLFDHPHILRIYEVFESDSHLYIVTEYAENRELFDLLVARKRLPENEAIDFFREIIYALEYLHHHGICHRDLKPENLLLDGNLTLRIADFGFARWMRSDVTSTSCGSPHYTAPEVIRAQPYDGRIADVWSSGIILFTMLAGRRPFDDSSLRHLLLKIKKGEFEMPQFEDEIQDLIGRILVVDPGKRITIPEIKKHPAFLHGLPEGYVLPSPVPLPRIVVPVDTGSVQPQLLKVLRQVGYHSDEDLLSDLGSAEHTMAKVFHYMLTRAVDRASLPWGQAFRAPSDCEADSSLSELIEANSEGLAAVIGPSISSDACLSLVSKPDWSIGEAILITYDREDRIEGIRMNSPQLFLTLQCIFNDLHFEWFHPDDLHMIVRTQASDFLVCEATYATREFMTLHIRMERGSEPAFNAIFKRIQDVLGPADSFVGLDSLPDEMTQVIPD